MGLATVARTQLEIVFEVSPDYCPKTAIRAVFNSLTINKDAQHEASLHQSQRTHRHCGWLRSIIVDG